MLAVKEDIIESCVKVPACRLCGRKELQPVISFGDMPLSNAFLNKPTDEELRFPLDVVFCPYCSLVQLQETVSPELLFRDYNYFSSVSAGMLEHARDLAYELIETGNLGSGSLVMEIASNDGYLLQYFRDAHIPVLGIDPAKNIADLAEKRGIHTIPEFFGRDMAKSLPKADVVLALNVLGHVSDLTGFVSGIREVLKPNGVAVIEVPYIRDMVESLAPDTIYFEHLHYFSLTALVTLFKTHGLQVVKAERIPIHCGSLRVYVTHPNATPPWDRYGMEDILYLESKLGVDSMWYYRDYAHRVSEALDIILSILKDKRRAGRRIVGFGAAAKGVQLLNYLHAGDLVDRVVDETPAKQGKYMPGTHTLIVPPSEMGIVDVALLLAWNWADEFKKRFPAMEGRWLIPFPKLRFE